MKVAICAKSEGVASKVDDIFGRCENFVIYDNETKQVTTINNEAKNESVAAGGKAVRLLNTHGVDVISAPEIGPTSLKAINAFKIKAYMMDNSDTVQAVLDSLLAEKLTTFDSASVNSLNGLRKA